MSGYADTPWVKIADTTITATWESAWIDLFLEGEKGDINQRAGVIRASVVTGAENKVIGASLTWLVASKGLDTSKCALVYREESGTVTAELWYKATKAYDSIAYVSLANGSKYSATNRKWILYSNRNENFLESLPDGTVVYPTIAELRNSQSDNIGETAIILHDHIDEPPVEADLTVPVNWNTNFSKVYFQIKTDRYNFADYQSNGGRYRGIGNAILNNLNGEFTADIIEVFEINNEKKSIYSSFTFKYDIKNKTISLPQESNTILAYTKIEITPIIYN